MEELVVADIGASGGIHQRWHSASPNLTAVLFEPDERAFRELTARVSPTTRVVNSALFEQPGDCSLYVCRKQEVSSVYRPNYGLLNRYPDAERYEIIDEVLLSVTSLDLAFEQAHLPAPHFIKVDTQGSELPILRGGVHLLQRTMGVEIEVEFAPIYEGQPLFPEVDSFMRSQGFVIYDQVNYYWKRRVPGVDFDSSLGDLIFADVLYLRPPESILQLITAGFLTIEQAVRCLLAYGYTHQSEVLAALAISNSLIDLPDQQRLRDLVRRFKQTKALSILPKAGGARLLLRRLTDRLFPQFGWHSVSKSGLGSY